MKDKLVPTIREVNKFAFKNRPNTRIFKKNLIIFICKVKQFQLSWEILTGRMEKPLEPKHLSKSVLKCLHKYLNRAVSTDKCLSQPYPLLYHGNCRWTHGTQIALLRVSPNFPLCAIHIGNDSHSVFFRVDLINIWLTNHSTSSSYLCWIFRFCENRSLR